MNDSNPENPVENAPETQPAVAPQFDARRRLRELLSVPERDRSDEQWDEIIELEIQLAPGNRVSPADQSGGGPGNAGGGHGKPAGAPKKHRPRNNNNRRSRPNKPSGNPA